jgi:hypothetical protein
MGRRLETNWIYLYYSRTSQSSKSENRLFDQGNVWDKTINYTDNQTLEKALSEITAYCNEHQYEIKAVTPLTTSVNYDCVRVGGYIPNTVNSGSWGFGYGWGYSNNTGFAVLLQKYIED